MSEELDLAMAPVKGGTFMMGATPEQGRDAGKNENPVHSVTVSDFCIGRYPVTNRLWKSVMGKYHRYVEFKGDDLPVCGVDYSDANDFIAALNKLTGKKYRLPTEAEWEYAARGGNESKGYKYSGSDDCDKVAWHGKNCDADDGPPPVGGKQPNELGIYDMSGGVQEWVSDLSGDYPSEAQTDPKGPPPGSCRSRIRRGGCYAYAAHLCRVSYRCVAAEDDTDCSGFRLASDA
jgi:formylglycine-generating enzyme required for sulfatase activity